LMGSDDNESLIPIREEIRKRVLENNGDLHSFLQEKNSPDSKKSYLILFEGEGGSGKDDFCLISMSYLLEKKYKDYG
ncbi:hypothetical protein ABK046_53080, partial [Streptomyces caeruleatus]